MGYPWRPLIMPLITPAVFFVPRGETCCGPVYRVTAARRRPEGGIMGGIERDMRSGR